MKHSTSFFALCLAILIAVVVLPGCSQGRQDAAGEEPLDEFDRYVQAGHHPALVRVYLKLRDGDTVEWDAPLPVGAVATVPSAYLPAWETPGGLTVLSAGQATLAPEGYLLMQDVLVKRICQRDTDLSPPLETVVMTLGAVKGRCEVVGDSLQIKLFNVSGCYVSGVATPPLVSAAVGSWVEAVFVVDLADFEQ